MLEIKLDFLQEWGDCCVRAFCVDFYCFWGLKDYCHAFAVGGEFDQF